MKTKLNKKLILNRETVRELTDSQLGRAVGGTDGTVDACPLTRVQGCTGGGTRSQHTHVCATWEAGCQTCG